LDGVLFNKAQTLLIRYPMGKLESSYTIPDSVVNIGNEVFSLCDRLTSITIPNSVTNIGDNSFANCVRLTSITIPNSVTCIGFGAFFRCTHLTSITIPDSVTSIGSEAFGSCESLLAISVDALNPSYNSVDGVLFNKSNTVLMQYPQSKTGSTFIIPNTVTDIDNDAFYFASLTNITIPNSVTRIGSYAFSWCSQLTSITIPNSVTSIGVGAFNGCLSLGAISVDTQNSFFSCLDGVLFNMSKTTLIKCSVLKTGSYSIPSSVTNIDVGAFLSCADLTSVTVPGCVTRIGDQAFYNCNRLTSIYFRGSAPSFGRYTLRAAENVTVYYLPGTTGWGSTYDSRPTMLWLPKAQASDASFGIRTNQFGFNISWADDRVIIVETCTNLIRPEWIPVRTNTLAGGLSYFSDPGWTNTPARFYRLQTP
jgi:hypothetical protein